MSLSYTLDGQVRTLHLVARGPSSVQDYEDLIPSMLREISGLSTLFLLIEIRDFAPEDRPQKHDLPFFLINQLKGQVQKCAFVCEKHMLASVQELAELLENDNRPTGMFDSVATAQHWLAG